MNYISRLINVIRDRSLSVEERVSIMFISVGVIAALVGELICVACHASIYSTISILFISITALISIGIGIRRADIDFIRIAMVIVVSVMIPVVFITAGGFMSGCSAWLIYELFYITLACKNRRLVLVLTIDGIVDVILMVADYLGAPFIYHLKTEQDIFISAFGSMIVVSLAILITVYFYKIIYNKERAYLQQHQIELEKANQFERNFLASMSHELRTPVNAIMGFNELILQADSLEKVGEHALDVKHSSELLMSTIDDILDFSGIELGKMVLEPKDYSLKELVISLHNMVSASAKSKGLNFSVDVDPNLPVVLNGDVKRIRQIILNLLTNAVKYSEKGNVIFSIGMNKRTSELNNDGMSPQTVGLVIKVSDEGAGISEEQQATMFTALKHMDEIKDQNAQGTGLGLTITKNLVDLMDGEIIVESTLGQGSIFTVILPQVIVSNDKIGEVVVQNNTNKEETDKTSEVENEIDNSNQFILVVDDTAINLKLMKYLLKNYDVTTVDRGAKAIEACQDKKYSLILMDIMMPEMDGVEAMKTIRKECYNDVPVIAVTADAVAGAREEYLSEGFDDYVSKPVKPDTLLSLISKYLQ
ncbi:MAG: response regulator [Lachnospiraceae bacterium]|nr:response regulator [Lachnospiraceae bacterium]